MRLKENCTVVKMLNSPAKPFQTKKGMYRQDGKKFTNSKMSKTPNKKEDFKGNWNEAWRIIKLSQEEREHEKVISESKGVKLEPEDVNLEYEEIKLHPKEVKSKHEEVKSEHKEVRVQSQLQLEFEQFKKKQLMNILPKINGNFGTEKEDENIENDQLNEAWRMIKQSQEKLEHKEGKFHEQFHNKKQLKDILPNLNGNLGAEIKTENKENGPPTIEKFGSVLNNKSNIKKNQPNHKFHDDLISKNRKILDNLFRR